MLKPLWFRVYEVQLHVYRALHKKFNMKKALPYILVIGSCIAIIFSFLITIEKMNLIQDPNYVPPCSINPIISCGSVMKTPQASVFGFPNSLLGVSGFSIMLAMGMTLLAGASFRRWFWLWAQASMTFAFGFIYWLFYQSVYHIGALCPYCMVVWAVTIPMFLYLTLYNLEEGHLKIFNASPAWITLIRQYHLGILLGFYAVIFIAILTNFWSYWSTLL